jgi:hypothetical protein
MGIEAVHCARQPFAPLPIAIIVGEQVGLALATGGQIAKRHANTHQLEVRRQRGRYICPQLRQRGLHFTGSSANKSDRKATMEQVPAVELDLAKPVG